MAVSLIEFLAEGVPILYAEEGGPWSQAVPSGMSQDSSDCIQQSASFLLYLYYLSNQE